MAALHKIPDKLAIEQGIKTRCQQYPPQIYAANWITEGWLSRRFPDGAAEEEFELTAEAVASLRFINSILKPRTTATKSRLANVIQHLSSQFRYPIVYT